MPWVEKLSDPDELRRCIRDLVALSTLPAMWEKYDSRQIAESVTAALLSVLHTDFVYMALPDRRDEPPIEIVRTDERSVPSLSAAICAAMHKELPAPASQQSLTIANPLGEGMLALACAPIDFGGKAVVAVGSRHPEFPTDAQRLLLRIAANEATIALQRWQMEAEQALAGADRPNVDREAAEAARQIAPSARASGRSLMRWWRAARTR